MLSWKVILSQRIYFMANYIGAIDRSGRIVSADATRFRAA
jgi:hypothetical protein